MATSGGDQSVPRLRHIKGAERFHLFLYCSNDFIDFILSAILSGRLRRLDRDRFALVLLFNCNWFVLKSLFVGADCSTLIIEICRPFYNTIKIGFPI